MNIKDKHRKQKKAKRYASFHWPSPKLRGQQARKKNKKTPQLNDCLNHLWLPRRSLSIVTAMSRRNIIRHYMRSDTGGLLVWHIRDMLRIIMQWCQLKAWNALRGKLECFPLARNSLSQNDGGRMVACAEVTIGTWVNSWWAIIELDSRSAALAMYDPPCKMQAGGRLYCEKKTCFPTYVFTWKAAGVITATY